VPKIGFWFLCGVEKRATKSPTPTPPTSPDPVNPKQLCFYKKGRNPWCNAMFYVKTLEHEIELEPIHFGQKLKATIVRLLKEEVEGLALANYGYVVNVIEVPEDQIRSGIIEYDTSNVVFYVKYTALLLRPFINEVLDATVSQCNPLGFFAFVGPLRIFVSKHSMPEDMFNGFDGEKEAWMSDDREVEITQGCGVRLKIKGRTVEQGNITAIGTIKDNYLGLIDDGSGEQSADL